MAILAQDGPDCGQSATALWTICDAQSDREVLAESVIRAPGRPPFGACSEGIYFCHDMIKNGSSVDRRLGLWREAAGWLVAEQGHRVAFTRRETLPAWDRREMM